VIGGVSFLADKRYHVSFKGRCSHAGAYPEAGNNALLAACSAVTQLYALSRHSQGASRINVGNFVSDNAANVISDDARFELDLRGETNDICDYLNGRAESVVQGAGRMHGVESALAFITEAETAVNSPELVAEVRKAALEIGVESDDIIDHFLVSGSEDATFIMNEVMRNGGLATYAGICSPTYGGHHNEAFDFDEEIMPRAVNLLLQLASNLSKQPRL
jgi:aminobenzoyl-glutamate utilization protein A